MWSLSATSVSIQCALGRSGFELSPSCVLIVKAKNWEFDTNCIPHDPTVFLFSDSLLKKLKQWQEQLQLASWVCIFNLEAKELEWAETTTIPQKLIAKGAVLKYCILSKLLTPNQASNTQPKYQTMLACSCQLSTRSIPQSDSILLTWEIACIYLSIYVCVIAEEFQ